MVGYLLTICIGFSFVIQMVSAYAEYEGKLKAIYQCVLA